MEDRKDSFTSLKDIISSMFNDSALPFDPANAKIWEVWDDAVGPGIAEHAKPSWIRKGCLRVDVSDPIWLQELEFAGDKIIEKLNEKLGRKAVKKIEFRLGSL